MGEATPKNNTSNRVNLLKIKLRAMEIRGKMIILVMMTKALVTKWTTKTILKRKKRRSCLTRQSVSMLWKRMADENLPHHFLPAHQTKVKRRLSQLWREISKSMEVLLADPSHWIAKATAPKIALLKYWSQRPRCKSNKPSRDITFEKFLASHVSKSCMKHV